MATAAPAKHALRFGPFELNLATAELRKNEIKVKLRPQSAKVLMLLARQPGEAVTREQLRDEVWGSGFFVDFEHALNVCIRQIRAALNDDADKPRYIETIPRLGYRFIARVEEIAPDSHPISESATAMNAASAEANREMLPPQIAGSRLRPRWLVRGLVLALVAAVVLTIAIRLRLLRKTQPSRIESLAVLPLANFSGDAQEEYFVDGMTDALITDLAKISSLRVISRTSVMRYKREMPPLRQVGKDLNVDVVVEGSVVRSGERVRITAQLIDVSTDRHLWAENYESDIHDVLRLQDDVARAIANQVQAKLTTQERVRLTSTHSLDPQAYDLYLKGRYNSNNRGTSSQDNLERLTRAIELFQRALSIDPNYAPAWAGIAKSYGVLGAAELMPMREAFPKAKSAALKALELDPNLGEAHSILAGVLNDLEWNWPAAEKEDRRAIELDSNDATAHQWYAMHLSFAGRADESIAEIERAHELDPTAIPISATVSRIFLWARQYDRAAVEAQKTLELEANEPTSYLVLAQVDLIRGNYQSAINELRTVARLSNETPRSLAWLAWGYALAGQKTKAVTILDEVKQLCRQKYCAPTSFAMVYGALGQKDEAFAWLDKALKEGDGLQLAMIKVSPYFDSLRSDPRFADVLRRRGLPQ